MIPLLTRFLSPNPTVSELASMRDEIITLRTEVVFASAMLSRLKNRREPRKDKQSVREAKDAMTERLKAAVEANRDAPFQRAVKLGAWNGMGKGRAA